MNRKKLLLVGSSLVIGISLLVTTAFASMAASSGYEIYKTAIKNTASAKSLTGNFEVSVKDNGSSLIYGSGITKASHENNMVSSTLDLKTPTNENALEMYKKDGKTVLKSSSSDVYNVVEKDPRVPMHKRTIQEKQNSEAMKVGEAVLDAMVGDLKNFVTANGKADGGNEVTIQLSGTQIPAVVNTLASLAVKNASEGKHRVSPFGSDLKVEMPKLVSDISLNDVNLKAEINKDNLIENQTMNFTISGKDAKGDVHEVLMTVSMAFSNFNSTTADTVDLTGKQVKDVNLSEMRNN